MIKYCQKVPSICGLLHVSLEIGLALSCIRKVQHRLSQRETLPHAWHNVEVYEILLQSSFNYSKWLQKLLRNTMTSGKQTSKEETSIINSREVSWSIAEGGLQAVQHKQAPVWFLCRVLLWMLNAKKFSLLTWVSKSDSLSSKPFTPSYKWQNLFRFNLFKMSENACLNAQLNRKLITFQMSDQLTDFLNKTHYVKK